MVLDGVTFIRHPSRLWIPSSVPDIAQRNFVRCASVQTNEESLASVLWRATEQVPNGTVLGAQQAHIGATLLR